MVGKHEKMEGAWGALPWSLQRTLGPVSSLHAGTRAIPQFPEPRPGGVDRRVQPHGVPGQ